MENSMKIKPLFLSLLLILFSPYFLIASQKLVIASVLNSQIAKVTQPILIEAYKRLGIEVSFKDFSAKRSLHVANEGVEVDGENHRIAGLNKKYPNLVLVPVSIYTIEGIVISKKVHFKVDGWESIRPYIIGLRRGIIFAENGTKGMTRSIVYSNEHLFNMLNSNRFDIILLTRINASKYLNQVENRDLIVLEPPIETHTMYHYLHKKNAHLIPKLSKVLFEMQEEGLLKHHKDAFMKQLTSKP